MAKGKSAQAPIPPALSEQIQSREHPWDMVPAIDVLQLHMNEGGDYDHRLNILFAGKSRGLSLTHGE
jgi:hypothetical protein